MVPNVETEFPSTSLWYDTYSAQESLETKAMVCHGQVGGEGHLNLSQTVFFFIFSFYFFILLFVFSSFFLSYYVLYLIPFPSFLFRSTNVEGHLRLSQTVFFLHFFHSTFYLIVLLSYCVPFCSFSFSVSHGQVGGEGQLGLSQTLCFSL